jgi:hypothetical protein
MGAACATEPPCHGVRLKLLILQAGVHSHDLCGHGESPGRHKSHDTHERAEVMRKTHGLTAKRPWTRTDARSTI